ncbi:DEAD/DEAH box helicase [Sphingobacterium sp. IITKGP-BTPF85]|uniref:DEAD/DEAH box helicase n=1 Tax=Sphingobacterium sp. IITKGP-BTPF85 TaxID=1338009 RepID=UPI00040AB25C|nr:helicase-related protein [Sphingobacterium sp. IITKGP-BTPF85]KKX47289.1 hypothetical protein L950_0227325 [Sphingobacterium sp. IITKGP-BTPF85]
MNLEFLLTLLKLKRKEGIEPQIILLSAVIGNLNGLERWLGGRLLLNTERPVPLNEGIIKSNGNFRYIESDSGEEKTINLFSPQYRKGTGQDVIIPLVQKLVDEGKNVIVFRETKSEAQACAMYLSNNLDLAPASEAIKMLPQRDPSTSTQKLRHVLNKGIAFHISDLDPDERSVIEEQFRNKESGLRVIAATTTLAMGVNTPTEAVIISGLTHPGSVPYSISEYKNIIGRAGRLGLAQRGYSYLVSLTSFAEHTYWQDYVLGKPEDLKSNFVSKETDCRSLVLKVLSASKSQVGMNQDRIIAFLEESFGAYQEKIKYDRWDWNQNDIFDALTELIQHKLIKLDEEGYFHTTTIGRIAGESSLEVESIIRIINVLNQIPPDQLSSPVLLGITQLSKELEQVYMPINRRSVYKEPHTWNDAINKQQVPQQLINAFSKYSKDNIESTSKSKKQLHACFGYQICNW